ncbi:MAG: Undecaprenyl-phosphate galactose phosphotransferase [Verrucomicrobia bacterium]|nr:Undecaprenyl-phosphate galactose phosphotransferase [Verrucomicrobiota bacterium]
MSLRSARLTARNYAALSQHCVHSVPSVQMAGWKRLTDVIFSLLAFPVLGVVTLVMAVVMKIVSPGPVFFHQERVGYLGRRFMIYKFRTMSVGADAGIHRAHCDNLIHTKNPWSKMDHRGDSRLIPGGKLIRASGLDELPQLVNVLRGEMSLIGPRPCVPYEYEKFLPWQRERFSTLPGMTGLWQVSGKNRTTFEEMIRLDIHYAHHRSLWLDARIVLLTPFALVQQVLDARSRKRVEIDSPEAAIESVT